MYPYIIIAHLIFTMRNNVYLIHSQQFSSLLFSSAKNCFYSFPVEYIFIAPSAILQLEGVMSCYHLLPHFYSTYFSLESGNCSITIDTTLALLPNTQFWHAQLSLMHELISFRLQLVGKSQVGFQAT